MPYSGVSVWVGFTFDCKQCVGSSAPRGLRAVCPTIVHTKCDVMVRALFCKGPFRPDACVASLFLIN